jgi:sugar phosphate isomerase/epimerase
MFWSLNGPAIGVRVPLPELIAAARRHEFGGVDFQIDEAMELAEQRGADEPRRLFAENGLVPTVWSLPVRWAADDASFQADLGKLPAYAQLASELGCLRTTTPMRPYSDERAFEKNFRWHVERFRPVAEILDRQGIRLGIEFIGPKTLRDLHAFPFIHTIDGLKELIAAIGTGNVGILLDCYHSYTSHATAADLERLRNSEVVHVHVNDAVAGRDVDEQLDLERRLPGMTGLIDIATFLRVLSGIGYDGGVSVEPFDEGLKSLGREDTLAATAASLAQIWERAGLPKPKPARPRSAIG